MCKRHQGSTRKTERVSQRAGCRQHKRIIRLLILTRFLYLEKENTVFTDPKDRQVKCYYPNEKAVTLGIESGQKEFLTVQRNQQYFFKYMEFVLTRDHFCN